MTANTAIQPKATTTLVALRYTDPGLERQECNEPTWSRRDREQDYRVAWEAFAVLRENRAADV